MPGFNFRHRSDATALIKQVRNPQNRQPVSRIEARMSGQGDSVGAIVVLTPSGGIPAISGTTPGSASCTPYSINDAGTLVEVLDREDASTTVTVYNLTGSAVAGLSYQQAMPLWGKLVVMVGGTGGSIYSFTATSDVGAIGTTFTADVEIGGSTSSQTVVNRMKDFDVLESGATGICHFNGTEYVLINADCPGTSQSVVDGGSA